MHECVCGGHKKHMYMFHTFRESLIRYVHRGLSVIGIFTIQNQCEFIGKCDNTRLATAELERH